MKKLLIAVATFSFAATAAYAAEMGMDCCKNCACCKDKEGDRHPAPEPQPKPK